MRGPKNVLLIFLAIVMLNLMKSDEIVIFGDQCGNFSPTLFLYKAVWLRFVNTAFYCNKSLKEFPVYCFKLSIKPKFSWLFSSQLANPLPSRSPSFVNLARIRVSTLPDIQNLLKMSEGADLTLEVHLSRYRLFILNF